MLVAIQAIFDRARRNIQLKECNRASTSMGGFMRMLIRCKEWALPSVLISGKTYATGERTETSGGELSLNSMSVSTD
jgi:hypothetical protein